MNRTTTYTTCWVIEEISGKKYGFTDHDDNIVFNDITFFANSISDIDIKNDVFGVVSHKSISDSELFNGKFDDAIVKIYSVDYTDPENTKFLQKCAYISSIKYIDGRFLANLSTISEKMKKTITNAFSPNCRAQFCDYRCGLNEDNFKKTGSIKKIIDRSTFFDDERNEPDGFYNSGTIRFINKENLHLKISYYKSGNINLYMPPLIELSVGDAYEIIQGCDKSFSSCQKFNNVKNFRGEPDMSDVILNL